MNRRAKVKSEPSSCSMMTTSSLSVPASVAVAVKKEEIDLLQGRATFPRCEGRIGELIVWIHENKRLPRSSQRLRKSEREEERREYLMGKTLMSVQRIGSSDTVAHAEIKLLQSLLPSAGKSVRRLDGLDEIVGERGSGRGLGEQACL